MNDGTVTLVCFRRSSFSSRNFSRVAPCSVEATSEENSDIHLVKPVGFLSESHVTAESLNLSIDTMVFKYQTGLNSEPHEDSTLAVSIEIY